MSRKLRKALSVLLALCAWQLIASILKQPLLLPSPVRMAERLAQLCTESSFRAAVLNSLRHILAGFIAGTVLGIFLAVPAALWTPVEDLLWPFMATVRSVPVASFIILCLIWLSSKQLSVLISLLMTLPIVYNAMLQGLHTQDRGMTEMADLFGLSRKKRLTYILIPQTEPFLLSSCSTAIGLSWKAGVAAELIGIPMGTIGEALYRSKVYFETADLFAYTVTIVLLSVCCEKLITFLITLGYRRLKKL